MDKTTTIHSQFGHIDIYISEDQGILHAIPNGYVGPSLVHKDLNYLNDFDQNATNEWKYIVDTSKVKIVNPLNPILLRGLKQL